MKTYLFAGLLALSLTACSNTTTTKTEAQREAEQTRARVDNARETYNRKMQDRLDKIDREIDEERAKAEGRKLNAKAKQAYKERMDDLEKLRAETKSQWNDVKNASESSWEKLKDSMDSTADKMDRAWENFKADMKS